MPGQIYALISLLLFAIVYGIHFADLPIHDAEISVSVTVLPAIPHAEPLHDNSHSDFQFAGL